jgi:hypothetical protein
MQERHESHLPEDLDEVATRLRAGRRQATALELDRLKLRAMHQASDTPRKRGQFMKSRLATLLTMGLLVVGAGGTFAIAKHDEGGGGKPSAGKVQYCDENNGENERGSDKGCKPGKGCGDKNHEHSRDDQCKKNEHGNGGDGGKGKGHDHGD